MRGVETAESRTRRYRSGAPVPIALPPAWPGAGTVHAVSDADEYRSSVRGVTVDSIRTSTGEGPIVRCLRSHRRKQRTSGGPRVNSRRVTVDCLDFAEATGRIPSVEEMCRTSHVSERRLRIAFADSYGMPPTQVLRMWALAKANKQLRTAAPSPGIVSKVAMDLGFTHLGRFAARYRAVYGESPSMTPRSGESSGTVRAASG